MFLNFALECAIRRVQVNQDGFKLNGIKNILQLLVSADDVNIWGGSVRTVNREALVVASKETGLEVKADETKVKVMFRDQKAGRRHSIKTENGSCEPVEDFKYLGTTLR